MKRHAGCGSAGGHAVIDEHDQHGVDHPAFFSHGHTTDNHQINHLGKRNFAE
jgi:hypothetical protein